MVNSYEIHIEFITGREASPALQAAIALASGAGSQKQTRDPNAKDNSLIRKQTSTYKGFHTMLGIPFFARVRIPLFATQVPPRAAAPAPPAAARAAARATTGRPGEIYMNKHINKLID